MSSENKVELAGAESGVVDESVAPDEQMEKAWHKGGASAAAPGDFDDEEDDDEGAVGTEKEKQRSSSAKREEAEDNENLYGKVLGKLYEKVDAESTYGVDLGHEETGKRERNGEKEKEDENRYSTEEPGGDDEIKEEEEKKDNASIVTARGRGHNEGKAKSRYTIPSYLDRSTINAIKSYLTSFDARAELDEDEIVQLMTKRDRNVEHRARYYANPLDDIIDEGKMHRDFKEEEEEYLVGHDFMKTMTSALNATRRRGLDKRTVNWVKRAAGLNRRDYHSPHSALGRDDNDSDCLGERGKSNLRRYTRGMAKSTRMKKQEEFVLKDNLGLKSLLDAIEELEPVFGPYPVPFECVRDRVRPRLKSHRQAGRKRAAAAMRGGSDDESMKPRFDPVTMRPLVARISEVDSLEGQARNRNFIFGDNRDVLVIRMVVAGVHVSEDEEDKMNIRERKRELKRLRDRQYQKRRRDRKLAERGQRSQLLAKTRFITSIHSNTKGLTLECDGETDHDHRRRYETRPSLPTTVSRSFPASSGRECFLRGPVSLPLFDWQRRQIWKVGRKARRQSDQNLYASLAIPEHLMRSLLGHRLPPWESINPASNVSDPANHAQPPRTRHSDEVYSTLCHKLINCLNGGARNWAIKEFFYSDLDKPWYDSNPLTKEVAKLGILSHAKLTRREWGVVRRINRRRPRRFSKRFILGQLRERNRFRNMARKLQVNADESNRTGFAIPAPIRVGATVTAYNKKFLILHRGVVLFHDFVTAQYLVQFERKELGFEFCSDTEVSSHGIPDILMPAAPTRLSGCRHGSALGSFVKTGELPYGTSFGPLSVAKTKEAVSCIEEHTNLLAGGQYTSETPDDENNGDAVRAALVEKVAERETLISLVAIIDNCTARKAMLLDVMEKFYALLVDRLPYGTGPPSNHVISGYFERHFAWLRANLLVTNISLEGAVGFMKVMYGKGYSTITESVESRREHIKKKFIDNVLRQDRRLCGGPPSATLQWIAALHHGSNDVGNYLSTLVLQENDSEDPSHGSAGWKLRETFLRGRMAAAGSVLSVIGYCCGRSGESDITLPNGDPPFVDVVLASSAANLPTPEVLSADMDEVLQQILAKRATAARELQEAFALLGKEFTGLNFAKRSKR